MGARTIFVPNAYVSTPSLVSLTDDGFVPLFEIGVCDREVTCPQPEAKCTFGYNNAAGEPGNKPELSVRNLLERAYYAEKFGP
jgi:hypothetical protein